MSNPVIIYMGDVRGRVKATGALKSFIITDLCFCFLDYVLQLTYRLTTVLGQIESIFLTNICVIADGKTNKIRIFSDPLDYNELPLFQQ